MFWFLVGYFLGIFTMVASRLHYSGKLKFHWYQWLIVATGIVIILYILHRYVSFEFQVTEASLGYTIWALAVPALVLLGLVVFAPLWFKHRATKKENAKEEIK